MDQSGQRELKASLEYLEKLSKEDIVKKNLYTALSQFSFLVLEAKKANFKRGWASELRDRYDGPLFNKSESRLLEDVLIQSFYEAPKDNSLNRVFLKIDNYLGSLKSQTLNMSKELGIIRLSQGTSMSDFKTPLPVPFSNGLSTVMVPVGTRALPMVTGLLNEAIRILYTMSPLSNEHSKQIMSLILGLIDILKGEWKQGILSIVGFLQVAPSLANLIGKVMLELLDFISPMLHDKIKMEPHGKPILIGFLLWGFTNFASELDYILTRQQFDLINKDNQGDFFPLISDLEALHTSDLTDLEPLYKIRVIHLILELYGKPVVQDTSVVPMIEQVPEKQRAGTRNRKFFKRKTRRKNLHE